MHMEDISVWEKNYLLELANIQKVVFLSIYEHNKLILLKHFINI